MHILVTGGTLDKDYDPLQGQLVFDNTNLSTLLSQANLTHKPTFEVLMLKDSLEMTDSDRQQILTACLNCADTKILITHGTDTMPQTAAFLADAGTQLAGKTIVLTGAMRPFALGKSDALFNLGSAIMALKITPPGAYIAMNGELFDAQNVRKNTQLGIFETQI